LTRRARPFEPTLWEHQAHADQQELEQVWFVGGHCDIGGGYDERELADITFHWMTSSARACGLVISSAACRRSIPTSRSVRFMIRARALSVASSEPPILGAKDPEHEYAAATAIERHKKRPYAPHNLTALLVGTHHELAI
jgi:hypothetical protein